MDAIATPFVQGRLREERLSFVIESECAGSGRSMRLELDSDLHFKKVEAGAQPLVFQPFVDFSTLGDPSIIDAF
ncbi:MAG: hypothetical protein GY866_14640 [Proteobacteria bacterium]|nr:hypothetical protein [Pseudomonadota bacterium]